MAPTARPIQVIPPGLMGFLQLKNQGTNPEDFPGVLQPVMELRDWYLQARSQNFLNAAATTTFTTGIGTSGFTTGAGNIIVPDQEWWFVHQYSLTAGLVAGDTLNALLPVLITPRLGVQHRHQVGRMQTGPQTGANALVAALGEAFWAPPGSELGFTYAGVAAVNISVAGYVRYTPLPV